MVAYIANTLVFILSGVVIAESVLSSDITFKTHENSWGYPVLLYVLVQVARAIVVGLLFPLLQYFGYDLYWREAIILFWSGMCGAIALALSLSVKFVFLTSGIVFLKLIVNGSTILHFLKMDNLSPVKKRILNYTKYEMLKKALEAFGDLRDDEELGPADWTTVRRYIKSLNDADGVQAAYWIMLDEGRINPTTANLLMRSVDEALDLVSHEALCDWKGDCEIAAMVISESEQEGEEARNSLDDVRVTFPQVLRDVKTRKVTYSVLIHLIECINNLEKKGLLEKKKMIHLHDAVQTDLKKFLRDPPLVKTPNIKDLISANPLLGALQATAREALAGSTKEIIRLSGTTVYKEGSKPTGIWLLSNGVVKWSTKDASTKQFLHPTFTHGSTKQFLHPKMQGFCLQTRPLSS
ncbi:hypothetical protein SASPL_142970 [Salvia splendens]|uniref:Cation/H+ exchanger transmembrane domain-containing protein n=1 Tax=Salvia splendens TaxID=180675 RepID=A0A8X8WMG4_SALSN|nr:hypothetical protein SASPL_142970 [Salvia splendens]